MKNKKSIKSLIIGHLNDDLDIQQLEELTLWITSSKENARFYTEIKDIWETTATESYKLAKTEEEWKNLCSVLSDKNNQKRKKIQVNLNNLWKVAAIFILGIFSGITYLYFSPPGAPVYVSCVAPKGSISELVLPDSSIVFLNAGTFIKYNINLKSKHREVFLEGEAWFKVSENKNKPFLVSTPYYNVNVVGTEFNVKAYPDDKSVETTLEKGSVFVSSSETFNLSKPVHLSPGEQLIFNKEDNTLKIKTVNTRLYTSWKDNKLIFINMSLKELIILMERKYDVKIEVNDANILEYHYSGTIKNETIIELLDILKHTLPLKYEIEDQTIKINKK